MGANALVAVASFWGLAVIALSQAFGYLVTDPVIIVTTIIIVVLFFITMVNLGD